MNLPSTRTLSILACAIVGAAISGAFAAMLASAFLEIGGHPRVTPAGLLPWVKDMVMLKPRDKGFYLLSLLLGITGAWWGSGRRPKFTMQLPTAGLLLLGFAVLLNLLLGLTLPDIIPYWVSGLMAVIGALSFACCTDKMVPLPLTKLSTLPLYSEAIALFTAPDVRRGHAGFLILLLLLMVPASFEEVATTIGFNFHAVSFFIGPATYFYGHGLIPGIDYYTQYGLGLGWLFYPLLGNSADTTMVHYAELVVTVMLLFHLMLFYLLWWLYRSWKPAAIITFILVIFHFQGNEPFFAPSGTPLRYPLLPIVAGLFSVWLSKPAYSIVFLLLSFCLGLSVFINTETGVDMAFAITLISLFSRRNIAGTLLALTSLGAASGICLLGLLWLAYGPGVFTMEFLRHTIEPLMLFGSTGMGGKSIVWNVAGIYFDHGIFGDWYLLYNIIAPGLALATVGMAIRVISRGMADARTLCLTFLALTALLMSAKYVNMSLIGVWQVNALGFIAVIGWWGHVYLEAARLEPPLQLGNHFINWYRFSRGIVVAAVIALTLFSGDSRNVYNYGLQSWVHYASFPHLLDHVFRQRCHTMQCNEHHPSEKDIQLIIARSKPGEPVAVLDLYDWTYLIPAKCPSIFPHLTSIDVFTQWQLGESLQKLYKADYIFLPKGDDKTFGVSLYNFDALIPEIKAHFVREAEGDRLVAWHRVSPHSPGDSH